MTTGDRSQMRVQGFWMISWIGQIEVVLIAAILTLSFFLAYGCTNPEISREIQTMLTLSLVTFFTCLSYMLATVRTEAGIVFPQVTAEAWILKGRPTGILRFYDEGEPRDHVTEGAEDVRVQDATLKDVFFFWLSLFLSRSRDRYENYTAPALD